MKSLISFQCQISRPFEFESIKLLCVKKIYDTHIKVCLIPHIIYMQTHTYVGGVGFTLIPYILCSQL
jgi:hypothetical protein